MAVVSSCEKPRTPPPLIAAPPKVAAPIEVPDAAAAAAEPEAEPEPEPTVGMPDDPPFDQSATEGLPLKKLLLRDPDLAAKALEALPTPDAWQVSLLAQLALKKGNPGPDLVPEAPMPEVVPEPDTVFSSTDGGTAYIATALLPLKASSKARAPTLMQLPINTEVTVISVDGATAAVSLEVATDVHFGETGSTPKTSRGITKTGVVDAKWLVNEPLDPDALIAAAAKKTGSELKEDEAVVLLHRAFLIDRTERVRALLIDAAWKAHRASWVVTAAMAQLHVAPKRIDVAYACVGEPADAKWVSFASGKLPNKPPDSMCLTQVELRKPCEETKHATWQKRVDTLERAAIKKGPLVQLVVDATRPRVLWFYSLQMNVHEGCASTPEYMLDLYSAEVRRLVLPLGTSKTVVRVDARRYDGIELGVVAAPNEAKARAWLRKRSHFRFTLDPKLPELNLSLGVGDTDFESETDVNGITWARPPDFDCNAGCNTP